MFLTSDACISGFKMIIDMDFDARGNLYVLQHATGDVQQGGPGVVIRVAPDMTKSDACAQYAAGRGPCLAGQRTDEADLGGRRARRRALYLQPRQHRRHWTSH